MTVFSRNLMACAAVLLLAACETPRADRDAPPPDSIRDALAAERAVDPDDWMDLTQQKMLLDVRVEGSESELETLNVNEVLADEETLRRALRAQFPKSPERDNLGEYIELIEAYLGEGGESALPVSGLGGPLTRAFLDAAKMALDPETGLFNSEIAVRLFIYGQIIHYEFDEVDDSGMGPGRIESITYITKVMMPIDPPPYVGRNVATTDAVLWRVNIVGDEGFTIVPREYERRNDPFPGTMDFTPAMIRDVEYYDYQFKLWAPGRNIEIEEVWTKSHGETVFTPLDPLIDSEYFYQGDENCIDMLFLRRPTDSISGLKPPSYCLGRCEKPGLVNTNAG